jgi:DNA (cytosine-5)-methyltransferase 1
VTREPYRLLDLFSGIGGFSLGLERSGAFRTVAFCEIEPFPRRVLAKHWPEVRCYEDVRSLTAERLAADGIAVDAICGGFPCQDISNAGHQEGLEGRRSGLWSEIARLVSELRPQFLIVENVGALLHRGMGRVLGDLAALGYDSEWHSIPASYLGAAHPRDRVWIVAHAGRIGRLQLDPRFQNEYTPFDIQGSVAGRTVEGQLFPTVDELLSPPSSDFLRNDDGLSEGVDRLKGLGNAVVPQIPELIGRAILQAEARA